MRQHQYDQYTMDTLLKLRRKLKRKDAIKAALKWAAMAVVFGMIGAMLAWRG